MDEIEVSKNPRYQMREVKNKRFTAPKKKVYTIFGILEVT